MNNFNGYLISNKLADYMKSVIMQVRELSPNFFEFSDECIVAASLEYSKYNRNFSEIEKVTYLYEKMYLFTWGKDCGKLSVNFIDELQVYSIIELDYNPF
jgi:hypothetical protein